MTDAEKEKELERLRGQSGEQKQNGNFRNNNRGGYHGGRGGYNGDRGNYRQYNGNYRKYGNGYRNNNNNNNQNQNSQANIEPGRDQNNNKPSPPAGNKRQ